MSMDAAAVSAQHAAAAAAATVDSAHAHAAAAAAAAQLPAGWEAAVDPASGRTYYVCRAARLSQFEVPQAPMVLPEGWESSQDPASGRVFFVNRSAGLSQWEWPTQPVAPLPKGWESATDPSSGRTYYLDRAAGVSQWERPTAPTAAAVAQEQAAAQSSETQGPSSAAVEAAGSADAGVTLQAAVTDYSRAQEQTQGQSDAATATEANEAAVEEKAAAGVEDPAGQESQSGAADDATLSAEADVAAEDAAATGDAAKAVEKEEIRSVEVQRCTVPSDRLLRNYRLRRKLGILRPTCVAEAVEPTQVRWLRQSWHPRQQPRAKDGAASSAQQLSGDALLAIVAELQHKVETSFKELNAERRAQAALEEGLKRQADSLGTIKAEVESSQSQLATLRQDVQEKTATNGEMRAKVLRRRQSQAQTLSQAAVLIGAVDKLMQQSKGTGSDATTATASPQLGRSTSAVAELSTLRAQIAALAEENASLEASLSESMKTATASFAMKIQEQLDGSRSHHAAASPALSAPLHIPVTSTSAYGNQQAAGLVGVGSIPSMRQPPVAAGSWGGSGSESVL
eukprot:TRINITY_DN42033_c0_g1_i3.p1 TRINITY_DN42033_c0_g1~~TRINITY_DN42033_c0_g1_i3.p1  ORF type:complete len:588 (-),score=144.93 TRINITY_DN42033_c0_g1_i3:23-1729(-)